MQRRRREKKNEPDERKGTAGGEHTKIQEEIALTFVRSKK
jgi:hypothetical protein